MSHTDNPSTYVCPRCDHQACYCHWYDDVKPAPLPMPKKEAKP